MYVAKRTKLPPKVSESKLLRPPDDESHVHVEEGEDLVDEENREKCDELLGKYQKLTIKL